MKKYFFLFVCLLFFSCIFAEEYKILQDANLREAPSMNSKVIKVLTEGAIYEGRISSEDSNWYELKVGDTSGFVHKSLVKEQKESLLLPIVVLGFLFIMSLSYISSGIEKKCPQCKKWFAREEINKELIDTEGYYDTVIRTDVRRNRKGEQIGTIERKEQVHMTKDTYAHYCKCKFCGHEYSYERTNTYEG